MHRILLALLILAAVTPLAACSDDPKVISTGSGPGVTVVEDDD